MQFFFLGSIALCTHIFYGNSLLGSLVPYQSVRPLKAGQVLFLLTSLSAHYTFDELKMAEWPWPSGSVGWSIVLYSKMLWVQFLVRAHVEATSQLFPSLLDQ